jgi:hypothetical protein
MEAKRVNMPYVTERWLGGMLTNFATVRKSIKQMFLTYPDLAGVGLTTGENMPKASFEQKEDWAFRTYAQGVLDAAKEQPGRKMTLIHRQHQTGAKDIARKFRPLIEHGDIEFIFSFKYAKAHVFGSTTQPYHPGFVKDIKQEGGLKTIWTLRNDDAYYFRWGAPDFVREFIQNIPYDVSRGFYYGSDQYIWGREFLSTEPGDPRQIEIAKHWYHWMLWGRLGYDPAVSNERFIKIISHRYPEVSGEDLFNAWQHASMIYPVTTGFHWGSLDFQWYIEACKSHPGYARTDTGFHDINRFITLGPHPSTNNISVPDYVKALAEGKTPDGTTPLEISDKLHAHSDKALKILTVLYHGGNKELRLTLGDIEAIALLGKYYAHKIRGATEHLLYGNTQNETHRRNAVSELNKAAAYWRRYTAVALGQYKNPLWMNRVGIVDWRNLLDEVLKDVIISGGNPRLTSMAPTPGGIIVEAEDAVSNIGRKLAEVEGYTGTGYVDFSGASLRNWVEWTFDVPKAGAYVLEVRYALEEKGRHPGKVRLNGKESGKMILWTTGGGATWAWDRKPVVLPEGKNTIRLTFEVPAKIDHLNIL